MRHIATFIASGFGSGFIPVAPGTWGSIVGAVLLYLGMIAISLDSGWTLIVLSVVTTFIGYLSIINLPESWIHDDGRIVIDEVLGMFVTLIFIPLSVKSLIIGLILFRIFDIWKPLGIRRMDNLSSGISVLADDLLAGVYANIFLRLVILLLSAYDIW